MWWFVVAGWCCGIESVVDGLVVAFFSVFSGWNSFQLQEEDRFYKCTNSIRQKNLFRDLLCFKLFIKLTYI